MAWDGTEECITSDHLPNCGFVPNHKVSSANLLTRSEKLKVSKATVPKFIRVVSQWLPQLTVSNTVEDIKKLVQNIC